MRAHAWLALDGCLEGENGIYGLYGVTLRTLTRTLTASSFPPPSNQELVDAVEAEDDLVKQELSKAPAQRTKRSSSRNKRKGSS
jgi:hypothetical protein